MGPCLKEDTKTAVQSSLVSPCSVLGKQIGCSTDLLNISPRPKDQRDL